MPLLPFDLSLTIAAACAVFVLGFMVWRRNPRAIGNALYVLLAMSLALWTSADWIVSLRGEANTTSYLLWKTFFYFSVCFGPVLAMHAAAFLVQRPFRRTGGVLYLFSILVFLILVSGFILPVGILPIASSTLLNLGALTTLLLYIVAGLCVTIDLYPTILSVSLPILLRRRATYGLLIFFCFLVAGGLQLVVGSIAVGFFLPLLTICFIVFSLLGFIRASFLDVEMGALEPFFLVLVGGVVILLLRASTSSDTIAIGIGSLLVAAFAWLAIYTVQNERHKRVILEEANRQLHQLDQARGDFVDMVAHQLRGPLGGIRSSASMLSEGDYGALPEKARTASELIQDSATRLLSLAETFLGAARLQVGKYTSVQVPTDVANEMTQTIAELQRAADAKQLVLKVSIASTIPKSVMLDREVLQNALFNLIDNAIKYTDTGSVSVSCEDRDGAIVVIVSDTGAGLSPTDVTNLFKKFQRGKMNRAHAQDGTGLGLYVVKELLEAAGGTIAVSSEGIGKGSSFRLQLPYAL